MVRPSHKMTMLLYHSSSCVTPRNLRKRPFFGRQLSSARASAGLAAVFEDCHDYCRGEYDNNSVLYNR
ncbi:hypothetical protein CBOM_07628 [Ceraceosorus bombacis]|uniref:Uncharacterized protein n=1 Tax=Ceraceosorus bombacis TaxID=401625 RepID=A0A0P1BL18_9BASI|nr:hypothetical protein CBOM_07628 [Ceraceosorus bombacis]